MASVNMAVVHPITITVAKKYSEKDRMDRYAFLQPLYLTLICGEGDKSMS
jgi:hypothetical protein